jgi:hypothetical protein
MMDLAKSIWTRILTRKHGQSSLGENEFDCDPTTSLIGVWDHNKPFPVVMELVLRFVDKHGDDGGKGELYHRIGMETSLMKLRRWDGHGFNGIQHWQSRQR